MKKQTEKLCFSTHVAEKECYIYGKFGVAYSRNYYQMLCPIWNKVGSLNIS